MLFRFFDRAACRINQVGGFFRPLVIALLLGTVSCFSHAASAQGTAAKSGPPVPGPAAPPVAAPVTPLPKLPPAQAVALKTRDGVQLGATFYPSNLKGDAQKDAVPVIMLHGYKGSRADFNDLALVLQAKGCAVLVPDLRGHGESTRRVLADGTEQKINAAVITRPELEAMVEYDVEACESFLIDKNNAKELNVDRLCVVGAEMGSVIAVNWAQWNWHWPELTTGKQGKDVKALILLSPMWVFKGLPIGGIVNDRQYSPNWQWLILVGGEDAKETGEAKRLYQTLEKLLPAEAKAGLVSKPLKTSLQGTKLLAKNLNASADILSFVDTIAKKPIAWSERKTQ